MAVPQLVMVIIDYRICFVVKRSPTAGWMSYVTGFMETVPNCTLEYCMPTEVSSNGP